MFCSSISMQRNCNKHSQKRRNAGVFWFERQRRSMLELSPQIQITSGLHPRIRVSSADKRVSSLLCSLGDQVRKPRSNTAISRHSENEDTHIAVVANGSLESKCHSTMSFTIRGKGIRPALPASPVEIRSSRRVRLEMRSSRGETRRTGHEEEHTSAATFCFWAFES